MSSVVRRDVGFVAISGDSLARTRVIGYWLNSEGSNSLVLVPPSAPVAGDLLEVSNEITSADDVQCRATWVDTKHLVLNPIGSSWREAIQFGKKMIPSLRDAQSVVQRLESVEVHLSTTEDDNTLPIANGLSDLLRTVVESQKELVQLVRQGQTSQAQSSRGKASGIGLQLGQSLNRSRSSENEKKVKAPPPGLERFKELWVPEGEETDDREESSDWADGEGEGQRTKSNSTSKVPVGKEDVGMMVQFEILRTLKKLKKDSESESSDGENASKSVKFNGLQKHHRSLRRNPKRNTQQFRTWTKQVLGVRDGQVWRYRMLAQDFRPTFGKMSGLHRVFEGLCDILEVTDGENVPMTDQQWLTASMIVQLIKAIHQAALDRGSWETASYLLSASESAYLPQFGGTEAELEKIYSYRKGLQELKSRRVKGKGKGKDEEKGENV